MTNGQAPEDSKKTILVERMKKRDLSDDLITAQRTEDKKETARIERLKKKHTEKA